MFDETTDCSVIEQLVIRTRYIDSDGVLKVKFVKMLDALKPTAEEDRTHNQIISLNATNIANQVKDFVLSKQLMFSKLVGIGTDGAPVMTGKHNGAVKQIIDFQKEAQTNSDPGRKCVAVGVHCAIHRLSLAASQAGDGVPYVKKFKDHLRKLYDFFHNSSARTAGLRAVQELLDNPKLKLLQPSSTSWLSVGNAVKRLKEIFASVVVSLEREAEERDDVIAAGLHHVMTEYKFVATMLLLCDVLPTVNRLSLLFQAQWIDFSSLSKYIQSAVTKLDDMNTVDGAYLKTTGEYVQLSQSGVEIRKVVKRGDTLDHHEVFKTSVQLPFLTQLITNINSRFKDGDVIFPLLSVLGPKNLPNAENLQDQAMNPRNPCDDKSTILPLQIMQTSKAPGTR